MPRVVNPPVSSPRISRSRKVSVCTMSSTLGSRPVGASAAATGTCPPAASWRMAVATCRLEQPLARQPSAPAASTAAVVAGWASPERTSSQVAGGQLGVQHQYGRLVQGGQLDRLAALMGQVKHVQVVLGGKQHPKPLGDQHMLLGKHKTDNIGHWLTPKCSASGLASRPWRQAGRAGAPLDPALSGSLLPLSGMAATPVGRQVAFLDRLALLSTRSPSSGWTGECLAGRWSSSAVCGSTGSGSWIRRSLRLLSRWGTLHDV